jgi:hypothetical protein
LARVIDGSAASGIALPKPVHLFLLSIDHILTWLYEWKARLAGIARASRRIRMWVSLFSFLHFCCVCLHQSRIFHPSSMLHHSLSPVLAMSFYPQLCIAPISPFHRSADTCTAYVVRFSSFTRYYRQGVSIIIPRILVVAK